MSAIALLLAAFSIVSPPVPTPVERNAAKELAHYLDTVVLDGNISVGGSTNVVFHVGDDAFAVTHGMKSSAFAEEEWAIKSFGGDVVLNGGGRGVFYSVSHFLEDECGVRWWKDDDEDVPAAKPLALAALDRRGKPFTLCRDIYRGWGGRRFAALARLNGNGEAKLTKEFGGGFVYGPPYHCHTWDRYVPFAKYGSVHPEWFSLVNGKRVGGLIEGQLCLTNREMMDFFIGEVEKSVEKGAAEAKAAGLPAPRVYDISMNDSGNHCQCDACKAEIARYGLSGYQLRFENVVAATVGAKHPEQLFSVLAYGESEASPSNGVRAADNVVVKLCNTKQNVVEPITGPGNEFMLKQIDEWGRLCKNLFVWEYATLCHPPTSGFPFPSEFNIVDTYRYYEKHNVKGYLVEMTHAVRSEVSDMYELKIYLIRKVMEDPSVDAKALMRDFYDRYYGPAARDVYEARRILRNAFKREKVNLGWMPKFREFTFLDGPDLEAMKAAFDRAAAKVAGDAKLERRVRLARGSIDRVDSVCRGWKIGEGGSQECPVSRDLRDPSWCFAFYGTFQFAEDGDLGGAVVAKSRDADGNKSLGLPFDCEAWDPVLKKVIKFNPVQKVEAGWKWYDFGVAEFTPGVEYIHLSRDWTMQLYLPPKNADALGGKKVRIEALLKFEGPRYSLPGDKSAVSVRNVRFTPVD